MKKLILAITMTAVLAPTAFSGEAVEALSAATKDMKLTVPAAVTTGEQRAKTLENMLRLNAALNDRLLELEIARDSAATPADRQIAENEIPDIAQQKILLKNKIIMFLERSKSAPNATLADFSVPTPEAVVTAAAVTTGEQRAKTLVDMLRLNTALNDRLLELEIARDSAATPADRQIAENEIPDIAQQKVLLKNKIIVFMGK